MPLRLLITIYTIWIGLAQADLDRLILMNTLQVAPRGGKSVSKLKNPKISHFIVKICTVSCFNSATLCWPLGAPDIIIHLLCDFNAADAELPDPVLRVDHVTPPEGPVPLLDVGRVRGGLGVEHYEILAACRLRPDQVHPDAQMGKSAYSMT